MCGRYRLSNRKQLVEEYFETASEVDWEPRYNISPSQNVGIVRQDPSRPRREFSQVRWGLIPYWAKEASIGNKMTNAHSETVADKPAFREAFKNRRCLVPADANRRFGSMCGREMSVCENEYLPDRVAVKAWALPNTPAEEI